MSYIYWSDVYTFRRKEIVELVPIKLIKRIMRQNEKGRKLMINTTDIEKSNN